MKSHVCHFVFFCATLAMIAGCGTTSSSNVTSGVTISGTLSGSRDSSEALHELLRTTNSPTSYTVNCVTLSGTASSCSGTCDSGGHFSCGPLPTGVPFGCFVEQSGTIVAVLAFTSSTTGLNNTSTSQGSIVAGSGATGMNLGQITLNTSTGTAVVTMANVTTTGGSGPSSTSTGVSTFANLEDSHGWTIQATPAAQLPPGVQTATTNGNNGPTIGQTIFLAQYEATDASSNTHVGLSIWNGGASSATAMTDYNACTSGGGEGAQLPSGFTAIAGPNNNASLLSGALLMSTTLPNPANVQIAGGSPTPSSGNPGVCSITGLNTPTDNCTQVPSEPGFNNPSITANGHGGTVGGDTCIFLCSMNNIGHATGGNCAANVNVNWGQMGPNTFQKTGFDPYWTGSTWVDNSGAVSFTADVSPPGGAAKSYFGGAVVYSGGNPNNRFMFGELIVSAGGIGTLSNQQPTQTIGICTTNPGQNGCPVPNQATCHLTELDQLTITETAASGGNATSAVVQLTQNRTLQNGDPAQCPAALAAYGNQVGQSMYMFNLVAN